MEGSKEAAVNARNTYKALVSAGGMKPIQIFASAGHIARIGIEEYGLSVDRIFNDTDDGINIFPPLNQHHHET